MSLVDIAMMESGISPMTRQIDLKLPLKPEPPLAHMIEKVKRKARRYKKASKVSRRRCDFFNALNACVSGKDIQKLILEDIEFCKILCIAFDISILSDSTSAQFYENVMRAIFQGTLPTGAQFQSLKDIEIRTERKVTTCADDLGPEFCLHILRTGIYPAFMKPIWKANSWMNVSDEVNAFVSCILQNLMFNKQTKRRLLEIEEPLRTMVSDKLEELKSMNSNGIHSVMSKEDGTFQLESIELPRRYRCSYCHRMETEREKFFKCGKCKLQMYCSKDCQRKAWLAGHKHECN